jgi:hypothetical protein
MDFPTLEGLNPERKSLNLPGDLHGELNVLVFAFQDWQQRLVDTWTSFLRDLEQKAPGVRYYEIPVLHERSALEQTLIHEGMRQGVLDPLTRAKTITVHMNLRKFLDALHLPHDGDIYCLLVDRQGQVLWRSRGLFTVDKGASLENTIVQARGHHFSGTPCDMSYGSAAHRN